MRNFRTTITSALVTLAVWTATVIPSRADTGTVRVLFSKAGVIAAIGNGTGVLTFHGKKYPFEVSGASLGVTLELSVSEFVGRAMNLRSPGDLAGSYTGDGIGGALAGGAGGVRLSNANGVALVLHGPKLGVALSANIIRITIAMK